MRWSVQQKFSYAWEVAGLAPARWEEDDFTNNETYLVWISVDAGLLVRFNGTILPAGLEKLIYNLHELICSPIPLIVLDLVI